MARWFRPCLFGAFIIYVFVVQLYRLYVYLYLASPRTYAEALALFPTNPVSVWSHNFARLREPGRLLTSPICRGGSGGKNNDVSILVLVVSRPERPEARRAIRDSWASYFSKKLPRNSAAFFALGVNPNETDAVKQRLRSEVDSYDDLLIMDILESYHNLSLKMVSTFRWIDSNCRGAKLVLKADDDVVIFGPNLIRYLNWYYEVDERGQLPKNLSSDLMARNRKPIGASLHCYVYRWSRPTRDRNRAKNFVPFELYPGRYYQPFCSGHAYLLTGSALKLLLRRAELLTFYSHLEDVLLTGILAQEAGVELVTRNEFHGEEYDVKYPYPPDDRRWRYVYENFFSIHYVKKAQDMTKIWSSFMAYVGA